MGGACSSCADMMGMPEIEVDEARVGKIVAKSGAKVAKNAKKNYKKFPEEMEKCSKKKPATTFEVPDVPGMSLEHDVSERNDIIKASVTSATSGPVRDDITNEVWKDMRPELNEQLPASLPNSVKSKALSKCKDAVVRPMVDKAVDKMLKEIVEKMQSTPDGEAADEDDEKE